MQKTQTFTLLVLVPEDHLMSGLEAIIAQLDSEDLPMGHVPKMAFGSMDFEVLAEVETLRGGKPVEDIIYASHAKGEQRLNPEVTWCGLYVGYVLSRRGRYPGKSIYRPASTITDWPTWAVFWEVQELERLKTLIPIGSMTGKGKKKQYQLRFIPEGPSLIEYP